MGKQADVRDTARRVTGPIGALLGAGRLTKRRIERAVRTGSTMNDGSRWDVARQAANVAGALFQVGMTTVASARILEVVDAGPPSPVEPAGYAFAIWGPIFGLSLAYAAYQARPATRDNDLLRRVGWFTAAAFGCTGLWSVVVPGRQLLVALLMLVVAWASLAVVYRRSVDEARRRELGAGERWLVALPVGIFLGWLTAAVAVSLVSEAVRFGLVGAGGVGEALLGSSVLLVGGGLAAAVVLAGRDGPRQSSLAYGATVLWALGGIVAARYDASAMTTAAAVAAAVPVLLAMLKNYVGDGPNRGGTRRLSPDAA